MPRTFSGVLPGPRQIRAFEQMTPIHTVQINEIDYAKIYKMQSQPLPAYVTDWHSQEGHVAQIRLVSYLFPSSTISPGETLPMTLYFRGLQPTEKNLSILVRLTAPDGTELVRSEGWPWGAPTSTWQPGDVWPDGHALAIPTETESGPYRLDVSFYESDTQERLMAVVPATGEVLGDTLQLDFVQIGDGVHHPLMPLDAETVFGDFVSLQGSHWRDEEGTVLSIDEVLLRPESTANVVLQWHVESNQEVAYTTFVHLVGPDGVLLTQSDQQPWHGFYPTPFWYKGRTIEQPITLQIPQDAVAGSYAVHVGLYDSESIERLPVIRDGEMIGDSIEIGRLRVEP